MMILVASARPTMRSAAGRMAAVIATVLMVLGLSASPSNAASLPPNAVSTGNGGVGLTVSWLPTSSPVQAGAGQTSQGQFWVTNQTSIPIPVTVAPATAVPRDNGNLGIHLGSDPQIPQIIYSPDSFVAEPGTTTAVSITVTLPKELGPGYYLIPAVVEPHPPQGTGNIRIQESIVALVTFKIPGVTNAHLRTSFIGPPTRSGVAPTMHIPGLAPIQLAPSGSEVLRVLDDSKTSFFAYAEITGTQSPFGTPVLAGHALGILNDIRGEPLLYFPGRYRDLPVSWHSSMLGLGEAHLHAYVHDEPKPGELVAVQASTDVLVISPWWIFALFAYVGVLALLAYRRTRRQLAGEVRKASAHPMRRRAAQTMAIAATIVVIAASAFLSRPIIFFSVSGVGVILAAIFAAVGRKQGRVRFAGRILQLEGIVGLILCVGAVLTTFAGWSVWPADLAMAVLGAGAIWALLVWILLWWNDERIEPQPGPEGAEEPEAAEPTPGAAEEQPQPGPEGAEKPEAAEPTPGAAEEKPDAAKDLAEGKSNNNNKKKKKKKKKKSIGPTE